MGQCQVLNPLLAVSLFEFCDSFTEEINFFVFFQDMKVLRGRLKSTGFNGGLPFSFTKDELKSVPKQLDWRLYGAVSSTPLLIVHLRKLCACFLGSIGLGGCTGHG